MWPVEHNSELLWILYRCSVRFYNKVYKSQIIISFLNYIYFNYGLEFPFNYVFQQWSWLFKLCILTMKLTFFFIVFIILEWTFFLFVFTILESTFFLIIDLNHGVDFLFNYVFQLWSWLNTFSRKISVEFERD